MLPGVKLIGSLQRLTRRPARSFTSTPSSCSGRLARIPTGSDFDGFIWALRMWPAKGQPGVAIGATYGSRYGQRPNPARPQRVDPANVRPRQGRDDPARGFRVRRFHLRLLTVLPFGQPVARRSLIQNPKSKIRNYSTCCRLSAMRTPFTNTTL